MRCTTCNGYAEVEVDNPPGTDLNIHLVKCWHCNGLGIEPLSPIFCNHANEAISSACQCVSGCYCRIKGTCQPL